MQTSLPAPECHERINLGEVLEDRVSILAI